MSNIVLFTLAIILNLILLILYKKISKFAQIYDSPDDKRKYHMFNTPLIGGLLILINLYFFLIIFYFGNYQIYPNIELYVFATCFFILGFCDDKFQLKANTKLIISFIIIAAIMFLDSNLILRYLHFSFNNNNYPLFYFSYPITILCILLFLNALNMFDGMNMQSGLYTLMIFIIFFFSNIFNPFSAFMIIALLFFLILNSKGKIFIGDSGTLMLGSIIAYIFIIDYNTERTFSVEEIFLIMFLPGLDLLRVAVLRVLEKRHPFSPDRNHIHHYVLNRYDSKISLLFVICLSILPFLINNIINKPYLIIFLSVCSYVLIVYIFSKYEKT